MSLGDFYQVVGEGTYQVSQVLEDGFVLTMVEATEQTRLLWRDFSRNNPARTEDPIGSEIWVEWDWFEHRDVRRVQEAA